MTSDEQLVQRMAAGDERALAELHRRYAPHLTAMPRRMLGDLDEGNASVQDAYVSAWGAAARFDPHKLSAKTWLVTLTHRLVMRRAHERVTGSPAPKDQCVFPEPVGHTGETNPSESLPTAEARDLLERAYFQGCTLQNLADLTGRPLEDIRQELRAAMKRLSGALGEREP